MFDGSHNRRSRQNLQSQRSHQVDTMEQQLQALIKEQEVEIKKLFEEKTIVCSL
jgi:hypothetical protein